MLYLSVLLESWLEGRCSLEKGVEATGMTAFGGSSRKVKWRTWENFIKSEMKLVSVYQELLHRDILRKGNSFLISKHSWTTVRCILPGLKRRIAVSQWSKVYLEIKVRSVENPKRNSAWSFFAGIGDGWCTVRVNAAFKHEMSKHFMFLSADKLYGVAGFLFQKELHAYPQSQNCIQAVCWLIGQPTHLT